MYEPMVKATDLDEIFPLSPEQQEWMHYYDRLCPVVPSRYGLMALIIDAKVFYREYPTPAEREAGWPEYAEHVTKLRAMPATL